MLFRGIPGSLHCHEGDGRVGAGLTRSDVDGVDGVTWSDVGGVDGQRSILRFTPDQEQCLKMLADGAHR